MVFRVLAGKHASFSPLEDAFENIFRGIPGRIARRQEGETFKA
jgi:hypothetical protein